MRILSPSNNVNTTTTTYYNTTLIANSTKTISLAGSLDDVSRTLNRCQLASSPSPPSPIIRCHVITPAQPQRINNTAATGAAATTTNNNNNIYNDNNNNNNNIVPLSKNWRVYQGSNNWEGLLDPLDDNLRQEILRYGEFVEAAYRAFDFDPESPAFATCKYPRDSLLTRSGIRETGYRITRHLRATCGVNLPQWADRMPSWVSTRSSWIGYVAVCQDRKEISRLGRRDVVIALRGTATCLEWMENLRANLTGLHDEEDDTIGSDGPIMVQSGFLSLYKSRTATSSPSLQDSIRDEVTRIIRTYGDEPLSFTFTGHSLGAALAKLAAYDIRTTFDDDVAPMVTVVSFGGLRVGNKSFRCRLEESGTKILRIVNSDDVVTKVPGLFVLDGCEETPAVSLATGIPSWFKKSMEDSCWLYADVGQELRLSSRESPHHKKGNVATCHELKTYLQLVNGFVGSRPCPFRASAKSSFGDMRYPA